MDDAAETARVGAPIGRFGFLACQRSSIEWNKSVHFFFLSVKRTADELCGFGQKVSLNAFTTSRVLAAFGKSPKLGKHAKPDIVGWVFV